MISRALRLLTVATVALGVSSLLSDTVAAADGSEFLGRWQEVNHPENTLEVTPSGKYFVLDAPVLDLRLKLNAVFTDGALHVSGPANNILATYDATRDRLIFLKEYQRTTPLPAPTPGKPNPDAIIAALAALPSTVAPTAPGEETGNLQRAELRRLATAILNEVRILDGAKDQYAIENNRRGSDLVTPGMLHPYLKRGGRLYQQAISGAASFTDLLGNPVGMTIFDAPLKVSDLTRDGFSEAISDPKAFWGEYANP